jgi:hypothetical protein
MDSSNQLELLLLVAIWHIDPNKPSGKYLEIKDNILLPINYNEELTVANKSYTIALCQWLRAKLTIWIVITVL